MGTYSKCRIPSSVFPDVKYTFCCDYRSRSSRQQPFSPNNIPWRYLSHNAYLFYWGQLIGYKDPGWANRRGFTKLIKKPIIIWPFNFYTFLLSGFGAQTQLSNNQADNFKSFLFCFFSLAKCKLLYLFLSLAYIIQTDVKRFHHWSQAWESNPGPSPLEAAALPTELRRFPHFIFITAVLWFYIQ